MPEKLNVATILSRGDGKSCLEANPSIQMLETPNVEEIARAIWQRQHDALGPDAISYNAKWRDESIPSKFWDEFLLDAHATLLLLYKKHIKYQNRRV